MFTKAFAIATLERAIKTFVQVLLGLFVANEAFNVLTVDWNESLTVAASATVLSVLSSFGSGFVSPEKSPSLVAQPPATPPARTGSAV